MLNPSRALSLNATAGRELPRIPELGKLYDLGVKFRQGQVMMIAGRSGTQKSGFALWLAAQWNVNTLYFSADMSGFTASSRLACMVTGEQTEAVEVGMADDRTKGRYIDSVADLRIQFSFGSPISWRSIDNELHSYVQLWNAFPELMVFDNLMDFEGAESDYTEQMEVMSLITELARNTGSTILLLHHATDKSWDARTDPWAPPSRDQIKGGLSEKPELSLSVALDPQSHEYRVAPIKQRMGFSDPTARTFATLRCYPELTRFGPYKYGEA